MGQPIEEVVMSRVRARFEASGLTLHDLGLKMGYPEESARKSAWQFMSKTGDPRLSMLHRFAVALEVPLADLIGDQTVTKAKQPKAATGKMKKEVFAGLLERMTFADVLRAAADLYDGREHDFDPPHNWVVVIGNQQFAHRPLIAFAVERHLGREIFKADFDSPFHDMVRPVLEAQMGLQIVNI
jgi:transcriptional regulator with XRE-family HTH domain